MGHLSYSLWFTLVWWSFSILDFEFNSHMQDTVETLKRIAIMVFIPAIAVLLEYLIMR